MRIDVITIFPEMFDPVLNESIVKRAQAKKKISIHIHDLRKFTDDKHRKVDDRPFGGGPGMVMMVQPIYDAVKKIKGRRKAKVVLLCPTGKPLRQPAVKKYAKERNLILICGHYEGVDGRLNDLVIDERLQVQLDPEFAGLQACIWGVDEPATASGVEVFEQRYLEPFLRSAHDLPED